MNCNMNRLAILWLIGLFQYPLMAQTDQFVVYTVEPGLLETSEIKNNQRESPVRSTGQPWIWNIPDKSLLPETGGSRFSAMIPAGKVIENIQFPASAAVKISGLQGDTVWDKCSGMMVGDRYVLTAAHCVLVEQDAWNGTKSFVKELYVQPGFDMGKESPGGKIKVRKMYVFKSYFNGNSKKDIALLELARPVGEQTGWVWIDSETDAARCLGMRLMNLSYPMDASKINLSGNFNGDTLYFKAGYPDLVSQDYIGIKSPGIPGESGSLLISESDFGFRALAVRNFSEEKFSFYRIKPDEARALNSIIYAKNETPSAGNAAGSAKTLAGSSFHIYPNPVTDKAIITSDSPFEQLQVVFYDFQGLEVSDITLNGNKGRFLLENAQLPQGNYFLILKQKNTIVGTAKLSVRK